MSFSGGGSSPPPLHPPPTASDDCRNKGPTENVLLAAGILKIFALRTFEFTYFWITRFDFRQARKAVTRQLLFGSTQVRSTFQIINILASQTLISFLKVITFSSNPITFPTSRSRDSFFDRLLSSRCNSPPLGTLGIRNHPYTRRPVPRDISRPSGKFWHQRWWS